MERASLRFSARHRVLRREVKAFVTVDAPVVALRHVRVIEGTGAAPRDDQTVLIADGKILRSVLPAP